MLVFPEGNDWAISAPVEQNAKPAGQAVQEDDARGDDRFRSAIVNAERRTGAG
jgi:hypothetical protein